MTHDQCPMPNAHATAKGAHTHRLPCLSCPSCFLSRLRAFLSLSLPFLFLSLSIDVVVLYCPVLSLLLDPWFGLGLSCLVLFCLGFALVSFRLFASLASQGLFHRPVLSSFPSLPPSFPVVYILPDTSGRESVQRRWQRRW